MTRRLPRPPRPVLTFSASVPKGGHRPDECDDRFAARGRRFAVADGVSEGGYSDVWAAMLADVFCERSAGELDAAAIDGWLGASRAAWQRWAADASRRTLPWFTHAQLRAGPHATFVGVAFGARSAGAWRAVACGDACLFVVRDDTLALAFPLDASGAFANAPPLVPASPATRSDALRMAAGVARAGDAFYLATDALAHWFLAEHERGRKPWTTLAGVAAARTLETFVADARAARALRNDDVTLLAVDVVSGG